MICRHSVAYIVSTEIALHFTIHHTKAIESCPTERFVIWLKHLLKTSASAINEEDIDFLRSCFILERAYMFYDLYILVFVVYSIWC